MKARELADLSDEELLQLADESFAKMEERGTAESLQHLHTAQFYLSLLNRRDDNRVARRDFRLEIIVIVLIALEIIFGFVEGHQQATILGHMEDSTGATATTLQTQSSVLSKVNENTFATVTAFGKLQTAQDNSLTAQKQTLLTSKETLKSISRMNVALEQELNLAFAVSVVVTVDDKLQHIGLVNTSKTAIYAWGARYNNGPTEKFTDERFIAPASTYNFFNWSVVFDEAKAISKGSTRTVSLDFLILSADAKQYIAHAQLYEVWEEEDMKLYPSVQSVKQEPWPVDSK